MYRRQLIRTLTLLSARAEQNVDFGAGGTGTWTGGRGGRRYKGVRDSVTLSELFLDCLIGLLSVFADSGGSRIYKRVQGRWPQAPRSSALYTRGSRRRRRRAVGCGDGVLPLRTGIAPPHFFRFWISNGDFRCILDFLTVA